MRNYDSAFDDEDLQLGLVVPKSRSTMPLFIYEFKRRVLS